MLAVVSDAQVASVCGVLLAIVTLANTWLSLRAKKESGEAKAGLAKTEEKIEAVEKKANGLSEKLASASVQEGLARGALEERDRVRLESAAVARGVAEGRAMSESGSTVATVNGTIAKNVEVVKKDVAEVKGDVKAVKKEVIQEVKQGVAEGIQDATRDRK